MGFFATFWSWLNAELATYIGDNTARVARALEPAVVTAATLYVMAWGYLHLLGKIEEPVLVGVKRIVTLALVLGVGLRLWLYNTIIVDTFYKAPTELAAAIIGGNDPVGTIDTIWEQGGAVAGYLWTKGTTHPIAGVGTSIAAAVVWLFMGMLCVYAMFLIALSSIALAVLLALGPLFIVALLFDATRRFFSGWLAQLTNYGLITVLTVMIAALLLQVVKSFAVQTASLGAAIATVDALNMILVAVLVFLILRQIMPIAASLSGGMALTSFGFVGRSISGAGRQSSLGAQLAWRLAKPAILYAAPGVWGGVRRPFAGAATSGGESDDSPGTAARGNGRPGIKARRQSN